MSEAPSRLDFRILLRTATSRDALIASAVLERAQFDPHVCTDMAGLVRELSAGAGAVMTYDQWEDGYESNIGSPTQSTTRVFGDGDTANGNAGTYCAACTGDLLPQGAPLIMRNDVDTPRPATGAPVRFDGRDKVASTRGFAITAGGFTRFAKVAETPFNQVLEVRP